MSVVQEGILWVVSWILSNLFVVGKKKASWQNRDNFSFAAFHVGRVLKHIKLLLSVLLSRT